MFLKKKEDQLPDAPRSTIANAARSGASPGQRILAATAAVGGVIIILGAMGYKYIYPIYTGQTEAAAQKQKKDAAAAADPNGNFQKPELNASMSLGGDSDSTDPAATGYSDKGAPPGMIGGTAGQTGSATTGQQQPNNAAASNEDQEKIKAEARRFQGSLDGFGGNGAPGSGSDNAANGSGPGTRTQAIPGATFAGTFGQQAGQQGGSNGAGLGGQQSQQNPTVLDGMLQGTSTPDGIAKYIPNQHLILAEGTSISCVLDTAIQTDQPGFVQCTTDYPVYSMDGKVVLAERGTIFKGEITKSLENGKKTIFVNWTSGRTPMGVTIPIASPGTDPLGRAGVSGEIDDKFWPKLKGALLFSSLEDGVQIATSRATNNATGSSNVILLPNTQSATQNAVGELVKQGADMKPTLYKNQGESIAITAARNIDFSGQYRLVARGEKRSSDE